MRQQAMSFMLLAPSAIATACRSSQPDRERCDRFRAGRMPGLRKGTAKLTVTALQSVLNWLHTADEISGPLAWTVSVGPCRALSSWDRYG